MANLLLLFLGYWEGLPNMVAVPTRRWISPDEYKQQERGAAFRSEYWDGDVVAMAGGSPAHNRIVRNLTRRLGNLLDNTPCEAFASETRVRVPACNTYFYPDALIVCGEAQYEPREAETILNPAVIIEVLSPGTEAADRGRKFACYRTLSSLGVYILLEQHLPEADFYTRQEDRRWLLDTLRGMEAALEIAAAGVSLPFADIYERVVFAPQADLDSAAYPLESDTD